MLRSAPSAHVLELGERLPIQEFGQFRLILRRHTHVRPLPERYTHILWHEAHPTILSQPAEVQVRQVAFLILVQVLEDLIDLLDAELNAQVVQVFLELSKFDRVVKISVEMQESVTDCLEALLEFDPQQVEQLLQRAAATSSLVRRPVLSAG